MADRTISRSRRANPPTISAPSDRKVAARFQDPALSNPNAAKCAHAYALLEEAWELIRDVLEDAGEGGPSNPRWQAGIPAVFPESAVEPLCEAICFMRPAENFPSGTTRAALEAAAEAEYESRH